MIPNSIREQYPVLSDTCYLNTPSSGLLSKDLAEWRRSYDNKFVRTGSVFRDTYLDEVYQCKQTLASIFDCHPDRTALIPNFSIGMNMLCEGLDNRASVLVINGDYPSLISPLESRGFNLEIVDNQELTETDLKETIAQKRPEILALSIVQWKDGRYISPDFISHIKATYPEMIIIADGTQYLGTEPYSFKTSGCDAMLTSGYKWLMAGYGNGFMFLSEHLISQLNSKVIGNNTFMNRLLTGRESHAQIYEPGHIDMLNFGTLERSVKHLNGLGLHNIKSHIEGLVSHTLDGLIDLGLVDPDPLPSLYKSGIINIPASVAMAKQLQDDGIMISYRDGIRLGLHFFNVIEDIDRFIDKTGSFYL